MDEHKIPCGALIKRISEMLDKNANNDLSNDGITISQMKVLVMLHSSALESVTLKELEKYFALTQATIAGIVHRLEKKKLLEGFTDPDDKRIKRVRITQKGRQLCTDTKLKMDKNEQRFMENLTPEEKNELERLLIKIYLNLQQTD